MALLATRHVPHGGVALNCLPPKCRQQTIITALGWYQRPIREWLSILRVADRTRMASAYSPQQNLSSLPANFTGQFLSSSKYGSTLYEGISVHCARATRLWLLKVPRHFMAVCVAQSWSMLIAHCSSLSSPTKPCCSSGTSKVRHPRPFNLVLFQIVQSSIDTHLLSVST